VRTFRTDPGAPHIPRVRASPRRSLRQRAVLARKAVCEAASATERLTSASTFCAWSLVVRSRSWLQRAAPKTRRAALGARPAAAQLKWALPGDTRVVSVPWTFVGAKGRLLTLRWVGGGCLSPYRTSVSQGAHEVRVAVRAQLDLPGKGRSCTADAISYSVRVRLRARLGHRKLRHAQVTQDIRSDGHRVSLRAKTGALSLLLLIGQTGSGDLRGRAWDEPSLLPVALGQCVHERQDAQHQVEHPEHHPRSR
jgi:hypothetical protein